MNILFELAKEHTSLPIDEIISCLNTLKISYKSIDKNENLFLIQTKCSLKLIKEISNRLSYCYYIDELFFSCSNDLKEIENKTKNYSFNLNGSFAVRYKNRAKNIKSKDIVRSIINNISINNKVDLDNPDNEIRIFITNEKTYVSRKIYNVDRNKFERRKVQFRPFFSPVSLHPKLARALVNLSKVKKNEVLLDPFCGTGGLILEAGLIGAKVIGSDIVEKMIIGCRDTLNFYNIKEYKLFCLDIEDIKKKVDKVDAVVTDLPYGKSTTTKGEEIRSLIDRTFNVFNEILKNDCRIVIGFSNKDRIPRDKKCFKLIKIYEFFSHRKLTRYFAVYQKLP